MDQELSYNDKVFQNIKFFKSYKIALLKAYKGVLRASRVEKLSCPQTITYIFTIVVKKALKGLESTITFCQKDNSGTVERTTELLA